MMTTSTDNDYVFELPYLNIDTNIKYEFNQSRHMFDSGTRAWKIDPIYPIHLKLTRMFNKIEYWYQIKVAEKYLKPHSDTHFRDAAIIIPITDNSRIYWYDDDNNIIFNHTYICPTLINTTLLHGTEDIGIERHNIQISLFNKNKDWEIIKLKLHEALYNG
jgi:hypothetical protein